MGLRPKGRPFADARVSGGQPVRLAVPQKASPAEMVIAWIVSGADGKQMQRDSFTDITKHLASDRRSLDWAAPPGDWLVGFFRIGPGGKLDKASGFAADPGSASAMRFHLDYVFSRLDAALSKYYGNTITDIACDSWEYDNRPYWSPASLMNSNGRMATTSAKPCMCGSATGRTLSDSGRTLPALRIRSWLQRALDYVFYGTYLLFIIELMIVVIAWHHHQKDENTAHKRMVFARAIYPLYLILGGVYFLWTNVVPQGLPFAQAVMVFLGRYYPSGSKSDG